MKQRDHSMDNLKFILMFLVVFGHLLECPTPLPGESFIYRMIYSFHMPAFIFMSGYYARFAPRRIAFRWLWPYMVFQTLYILFDRYALGGETVLQYTTPYWHLWYMLACAFFQLLIPVYDASSVRGQVLVLTASLATALLAGFDDTVGYYMSLSRFLVFQPWFILGFYCRRNGLPGMIKPQRRARAAAGIVCIGIIGLSVVLTQLPGFSSRMLYGSFSYSAASGTLWSRAALMVVAAAWIVFLFFIAAPVMNRRIPVVTAIGKNTMPVFLMHGFLVKLLIGFASAALDSYWKLILITFGILIVFGNRLFARFIDIICLRR